MFQKLKQVLYFPLASYFRFFAKIRLARWNPRIILITGSSGKTTTLHLLESQIGDKARYTHHANSSYGIPFNILGLERKETLLREWPLLFILAPIKAFFPSHKQKLYVVEADCDRPGEGRFLTNFLKPEVTLWLSLSKTHSMNFDKSVISGKFSSIEDAIAYEFGFFIEYTSKLVLVDGDSPIIAKQLHRTKAEIIKIKQNDHLQKYSVSLNGSEFKIDGHTYKFPNLLPQVTSSSITMSLATLNYLNIKPDLTFSKFHLPPGRSSVFRGIKNTTIVDSTYNASFESMVAILKMFNQLQADKKWVVLGDMLELGEQEASEHEKLAQVLAKMNLKRIVLMGPRLSDTTYPKLKSILKDKVVLEKFLNPRDVLDYLNNNLKGGETLLFKGARFLEGVIENLLEDKSQAKNLSRREKYWEKWRKKWGV